MTWIEADVTDEWPVPAVDIWHDRAVFHFLIEPEDRSRYLARLRQSVKPQGTVIIAAFALDGPERCSGLPVQRYSGETFGAESGAGFELVERVDEAHRTLLGVVQSFCYSRFLRVGSQADRPVHQAGEHYRRRFGLSRCQPIQAPITKPIRGRNSVRR